MLKRNKPISKFKKWFLKYLCKEIVIQGTHRECIIEYYRIMMEVAREEFTEDNKPTLDGFMLDCFKEAQKSK